MLTSETDTQILSSSQSLTLGQAAKEAGVTKAAVRAAIKRNDISGATQNERGHYSIPLAQVLQYRQRFTSTPTDTVDLEPDTPAITPVKYPEDMVPMEVYRDTVQERDDWKELASLERARGDRQESRMDRLLTDPKESEQGRGGWLLWVLTLLVLGVGGWWIYVNLNPVT